MKSVSKCTTTMPSPLNRTQLTTALLRQTYQQHSLEHCFPASNIIDQALKSTHRNIQAKNPSWAADSGR